MFGSHAYTYKIKNELQVVCTDIFMCICTIHGTSLSEEQVKSAETKPLVFTV